MRILAVDDEPMALDSLKRILRRRGLEDVEVCGNGTQAVEWIRARGYDVVLLDLIMPDLDGLKVLEETKPYRPETEFIILTAVHDLSMAVKAVRLGAYDYLVKPMENERLHLSIQRAYEHKGLLAGLAGTYSLKSPKNTPGSFSGIITRDPRMKELLAYAEIVARGGNPVLITGESGTGKELLARGIHRAGPCPNGPFVAVNVSSVPETLFESHFFGHLRGAFTGAGRDHVGYFEQADEGTLFLDEIGELPLTLQAKLLRVLEEQTVTRLGSQKARPVAVRLVSATNVDLEEACRKGRFRPDLMYRLKSAHVHLPPLRERQSDIALLADHFAGKAAARYDKAMKGFSHEALELLSQMEFPGNIRQLNQMVAHAVLLADSPTIHPVHLGIKAPAVTLHRSLCSLKEDREKHVVYVLTQAKGDRSQAARILGVTVRQIQRVIAGLRDDPRWAPFLSDV